MEVNLDMLQKALQSASKATDISLKLQKRHDLPSGHGSLIFTMKDPLLLSTSVITQDLPIRLLSNAHVSEIREPQCPTPDVHVVLPPLHMLKNISERIKILTDRIILIANSNGQLSLRAEADSVKIETTWNHLPKVVAEQSGLDRTVNQTNTSASVCIHSRDWNNILKVYTVAKKGVACKHAFHFHFSLFSSFHVLCFILSSFYCASAS